MSFDPICRNICTTFKFVPITLPRCLRMRNFSRHDAISRLVPASGNNLWRNEGASGLGCQIFFLSLSPSFQISSTHSRLFRWSRTLVSNFSANHSPVYSYLPFIPSSFFSYRLLGLRSRMKRTGPNFAIPQGFIYSSPKFRVFRLRFVGVLQFPATRSTSARTVWQELPAILSQRSLPVTPLWARHCWKVYILQITRVNSRNSSLKI